ncbi:hypothetical protein ACE38W_03830 [Chitinophaga sp. Hz27]|uniref:hypothetical protein n=1 Tax=Chitinophaga sp. Hz27 TaxID=3347169 RepID=UPI0035DC7E38
MKKDVLLLLCFLLFFLNLEAQTISQKDSINIRNNIIFYHIRNAVPADIPEFGGQIWRDSTYFLFEKMLPINGHLRMEFKPFKGKGIFPLEGFHLTSLYMPQVVDLDSEISYSVRMLGFYSDEDYLIAHNDETGRILYISGNFFKSPIAQYFNLDPNKPESFYNYLMLRCYNVKPDNIHYLKSDEKGLYFSIWSNVMRDNITFLIDSKCYDNYKAISIGGVDL